MVCIIYLFVYVRLRCCKDVQRVSKYCSLWHIWIFNLSNDYIKVRVIDIYKTILHVKFMNVVDLKRVNVKAVVNKANGQINFSIPKKKICQEVINKAYSGKTIKLLFED